MASFLDDSRLAAPAADAPRQYVPERVELSELYSAKPHAALKNTERALLTFAVLFSCLIGVFSFMSNYLPVFMHIGFVFPDAYLYYAGSICILLPTILLLPALFFRTLEVTYLLSAALFCFFAYGVSQALRWNGYVAFPVGKLEINMIYFCAFAAAQMACTIVAFILHGVRAQKQKQPVQQPARHRAERPRQLKEPATDLKEKKDRAADQQPTVEYVALQEV